MSRDEVAAALIEVTAGRIPRDRLALKELVQEVRTWPFLDAEEELQAEQQAQSNYEGITDTGLPATALFEGLRKRKRSRMCPIALQGDIWCDIWCDGAWDRKYLGFQIEVIVMANKRLSNGNVSSR